MSDKRMIFAFFSLKACIILLRFGFFPIEFGLKDKSLNFEAEAKGEFLFNFS